MCHDGPVLCQPDDYENSIEKVNPEKIEFNLRRDKSEEIKDSKNLKRRY
jgi:hypothetical protein